jgi:RNA polymerase sigma-70 factor (ECF subfamily)
MTRTASITIPEETLVQLLKQRDPKSFEYLYRHYSTALYSLSLRIVRSRDLVDDVVQDIFTKIWKNIGSYERRKGTLFTWMLNIARNTAIDRIRLMDYKTQYQSFDLSQSVYLDELHYTDTSLDSIGLSHLMGQLKAEHQLVIDYLYLRGYSQSEFAEEWGIPLGTVKSRVKVAMNELRKLMHADVALLA